PSRGTTHLREWLDRALLAGVAEDARIEVRGDLARWPFDDPERGRFRITAAVRDATLAYAPAWPRLEQIRGDLVVDGASFEMRGKSAIYEGTKLSEVRVRMPDHHAPVLTIDGRAAGPAQDLLRFVNDSPLAANLSGFTRDLKVGGDARLGLHLVLPLDDMAATKVAGGVDFAGNDVEIDRGLPTVTAVSGRLEFTERGITLPELRGTLLGGPIRVEGRSAGEGRMHIDATGAIDGDGLRQLLDNPFSRRIQGRTEYTASVDVERRAATVRIESDLVGMASTLPAPFAKAAGAAWPLRLVSQPLRTASAGPRAGERLEVRIGEDIALIVERERDPATDRLRVRRASFALDGEPVLRDSGLAVLLRTRALDVDAWRTVIGDGELERIERSARVGGATGMSLVPDLVSVVADDLRVAGRDLHDVVLGASRTDGRWRANIASREIEGHFDWRDARAGERIGTLTARFARLVIPSSRIVEVESALSAPPNQLPALDVTVEELVLGTLPVGRLELAATNGGTPEQPVWRLDRAVVVNPAARLEARGTWSFVGARRPGGAPTASIAGAPSAAPAPDPGGRSTELDFELELKDSGRLLAGMGLKDTVHGGTGSLSGRVHWHGAPVSIDYGSLEGRVKLAIGKGEFLKVDPGAAKLIGVLNMQSLPKRLTGDFRDLFGEGFAFDTLDGQVRIERGIARTDDLHMRGLQAQVKIRGEADLKLETQRLNVEVVPELNAGLAS
ncbi:MAG: YhdP family protein, partial [Burkholderiaceae bacterium]